MNPCSVASQRSRATWAQQNQGFITINSATGVSGFVWETLNRSTFYDESAQLCDAGISKIKVLDHTFFALAKSTASLRISFLSVLRASAASNYLIRF